MLQTNALNANFIQSNSNYFTNIHTICIHLHLLTLPPLTGLSAHKPHKMMTSFGNDCFDTINLLRTNKWKLFIKNTGKREIESMVEIGRNQRLLRCIHYVLIDLNCLLGVARFFASSFGCRGTQHSLLVMFVDL